MKCNLLWKTLLSAATVPLVLFTHHAQAQSLPIFKAVTTTGGTGADLVITFKSDAAGNLYSSGFFAGTVNFGSFPLTSSGSTGNYVAKQDANGNYLWAVGLPKYSTAPLDPWKVCMAVDPAGNVYTAGRFTISLTLGSTTLTTSNTDHSMFIAKQAPDGSYLWAVAVADPIVGVGAGIIANTIAADAAGNVYLTGGFNGTIDFDPGAATADLTATSGVASAFILKLDATGNYAWAKALLPTGGSTLNAITTQAITVDVNGNVYTTGFFTLGDGGEFADFDPGPGQLLLQPNGPGHTAHFINKLNASGNHVWTRQYGNTETITTRAISIAVDNAENVYASGWLEGTGDFDPGAGTATLTATSSSYDAFITKLDAAGGYVWAKLLEGTNSETIRGIQLDNSGNVYMTGAFTGTVDLDPSASTAALTAPGTGNSVFISKWDSNGGYIDAVQAGNTGTNSAQPMGLVVNGTGTQAYVGGFFSGTIDFDPGAGSSLGTSAGGNDAFFLHLAPATLPITLSSFKAVRDDTKAVLTWATATESNNKGFYIQRSSDSRNWQSIRFVSSKAAGGNSTHTLTYTFTDESPLAGVNYYRLQQIDFDGRTSNSVIRPVNFNNRKEISVFPNPAKGNLYLSGITGGETILLYNTTGQLLSSQRATGDNIYTISLQGLTKGSYYVKVNAKDGVTRTFQVAVE